MKRVVVVFMLTLAFSSNSQDSSTHLNGVFGEVYLAGYGGHTGPVGWASVNYNRKVGQKKFTCLRTGLSSDFRSAIGIPLVPTFLVNPNGNHHLEAGLGINNRIEFYNGVHYDFFGMLPIIYRYESDGGLLLRAGVNYFFYSYAIWYPTDIYLSFSVGYAF